MKIEDLDSVKKGGAYLEPICFRKTQSQKNWFEYLIKISQPLKQVENNAKYINGTKKILYKNKVLTYSQRFRKSNKIDSNLLQTSR